MTTSATILQRRPPIPAGSRFSRVGSCAVRPPLNLAATGQRCSNFRRRTHTLDAGPAVLHHVAHAKHFGNPAAANGSSPRSPIGECITVVTGRAPGNAN